MQFFKSVAVAVSAIAAFAAAQSTEVAIYNMPSTVQVGKTTTLHTKDASGYTLTLRRGDSNNLQNVSTITTTGSGSSFDWTPSSDLESGSDYAIMISKGTEVNYTPEFTITGGKAKGSSPSSASSSASASAPAGYGASAPSTMATAAKTADNCAVTQISDGQPQAPPGCSSSSSAPAASSASAPAKVAPAPSPYIPMPGATGSPATSNTTMPTYSVPSTPTGSSGNSGSASAPSSKSSQPASGAAQFGSSLALIAGAAAAFVFLN